jgi:hypothetical protein
VVPPEGILKLLETLREEGDIAKAVQEYVGAHSPPPGIDESTRGAFIAKQEKLASKLMARISLLYETKQSQAAKRFYVRYDKGITHEHNAWTISLDVVYKEERKTIGFSHPLSALKVHDTLRDAFNLPDNTIIRGLTEVQQSSLQDVFGGDLAINSDGQFEVTVGDGNIEKVRQYAGILARPDSKCLKEFWDRLAASSATQRSLVPFVSTSDFYSISQWWHCRNAESSRVTVRQHKIVTPRIKGRGKGEFGGNPEDGDICVFRSFLQKQNIHARIRFLPSFGPIHALARACGLGVVWIDGADVTSDISFFGRLWKGTPIEDLNHWSNSHMCWRNRGPVSACVDGFVFVGVLNMIAGLATGFVCSLFTSLFGQKVHDIIAMPRADFMHMMEERYPSGTASSITTTTITTSHLLAIQSTGGLHHHHLTTITTTTTITSHLLAIQIHRRLVHLHEDNRRVLGSVSDACG